MGDMDWNVVTLSSPLMVDITLSKVIDPQQAYLSQWMLSWGYKVTTVLTYGCNPPSPEQLIAALDRLGVPVETEPMIFDG